jgi:hypothetical protein
LSLSCSLSFFYLFLTILLDFAAFVPFVGFCSFPLLDDILELFLTFWVF